MDNNQPDDFYLQGLSLLDIYPPRRTPRIWTANSRVVEGLPESSARNISRLTDRNVPQRRTAEGVFQLRDNFNNVIQGFQPLVETARAVNAASGVSISNLFNRPAQTDNVPPSGNMNDSSNFVINLENLWPENQNSQRLNQQLSNVQISNPNLSNPHQQFTNQQLSNQQITNQQGPNHQVLAINGDNPNGNGDFGQGNNNALVEQNSDRLPSMTEATELLAIFNQYIPFALILLVKALYDHHEGILNFLVLLVTFTHANSVVKREATKRSRRNLAKLFLAFLYINICILFIHYIFEDKHLYLNLIFIRTYEKPLSWWDLLWVVGITDFILKLITIMCKLVLTMLPGTIVAFEKRGKIYLFMEALSQLYRSLAPIQPWLYYLLESYQGPEKIVGVFLSAAYMVSKGRDLVIKAKLMKTAVFKLLQNVAVGSSPSKEQIQTAGEHCPICHDEYNSPVLLQCRHIFCESCVTTWFDREQTCPLCRARIVDDPSWRDGSTTFIMQLF